MSLARSTILWRGQAKPGQRARLRLFALFTVMVLALVGIGLRLTDLQGVQSGHFVTLGHGEWLTTVTLPAERGSILASNGDELALSLPRRTICADPQQVTNATYEARRLAPILDVSVSSLRVRLAASDQFQYLAHTVPTASADAVAKLNLPGIFSIEEPKTFYPMGQVGLSLIGQVGSNDQGLTGLELKYNRKLEGRTGKEVEVVGPDGQEVAGGLRQYRAQVAGDDVVTTIDESLQYEAEQALAQALVASKGRSGTALIMDTKTGAILADANLEMPTASDPATENEPPAVNIKVATSSGSTTTLEPVEAPSALAFTQAYEPGSVNKIVTFSAALQDLVISPTEIFAIPNGYPVGGTVIHDAGYHATEYWTPTNILTNSSDIGTVEIAQKLGRARLLRWIHRFGFGKVSAVDFPGESTGILPSQWSGTSVATVPIGQGIAVTAIQMLAAYNAVANGGVYVQPRLVQGFVNAKGIEHRLPVAAGHRIMSKAVADQLTTMLDEVVRVGTGVAANLQGDTVAGKTGTAETPYKGGYLRGSFTSSFAGFAPAAHPALTAMVVVHGTPDYGAGAPAPTFANVVRFALRNLKVQPSSAKPPADGVPLATTGGAGDAETGVALPGLANPPEATDPDGTPSGAKATTGTTPDRMVRRRT